MSRNQEIFSKLSFVYTEDQADWAVVWDQFSDGASFEELQYSPFSESLDDLYDLEKINVAEDPEEETVRQANELLRRDIAACEKIWADPSLGGEDVEVKDGSLIVRGHEYPGPGGYESPYWQFSRVLALGVLPEAGIVRG